MRGVKNRIIGLQGPLLPYLAHPTLFFSLPVYTSILIPFLLFFFSLLEEDHKELYVDASSLPFLIQQAINTDISPSL